jgi:hypothetical protein
MSKQVFEQFVLGLADYTSDRRGDVGSWVRMAAIRSFRTTLLQYSRDLLILKAPEQWIPPSVVQSAVSGILKQSAERLDNVRLVAVETLLELSSAKLPKEWSLNKIPVLDRDPSASYVPCIMPLLFVSYA